LGDVGADGVECARMKAVDSAGLAVVDAIVRRAGEAAKRADVVVRGFADVLRGPVAASVAAASFFGRDAVRSYATPLETASVAAESFVVGGSRFVGTAVAARLASTAEMVDRLTGADVPVTRTTRRLATAADAVLLLGDDAPAGVVVFSSPVDAARPAAEPVRVRVIEGPRAGDAAASPFV
jgi:hypothetical protein